MEESNVLDVFQGENTESSLFDVYDKSKTYVRITEDDKSAWLYLMPKEDGQPYTKEELLSILRFNEVQAGIDEDKLIAMAKKSVFEREIKVAECVEPVAGSDGYYEYFFDINSSHKRPTIREDGSVDYQSMNMVNNVKEGAVLAQYHPSVPGIEGKDVRGYIIPVDAVKELPALQGKGLVRDESDNNRYLAEYEGKAEYKDGKVHLEKIHQISGDVDQIIGKVEFFGDVLISGSVEAGTVIRAGKSLTIEGTVEAAQLIAGGDIILKRGIQGNQKAQIVCKGTLYADFIEHTQIKAGGNVEANYILNSNIEAEGKVILTGKKGTLIGGNVHGTKGIDCKELGNDAEVKTIVHAGCQADVILKQRKLMKEEEELRDASDRLLQEVKEIQIKVKHGGMSPILENRLKAITQEKKDLDKKITDCRGELANGMQYIEKAKGATIRIDGNLHKGSVICIDQGRLPIEKSTMYMEYRNISGMIAGSVIVKN